MPGPDFATLIHYPRSQLTEVVRRLATGPYDVRDRLRNSYMELIPIQSRLLPEQFREDFDWIMAQLRKYEPTHPQQGRIDATLDRIQNRTGAKIAERIFDLHMEIEYAVREDERRRRRV